MELLRLKLLLLLMVVLLLALTTWSPPLNEARFSDFMRFSTYALAPPRDEPALDGFRMRTEACLAIAACPGAATPTLGDASTAVLKLLLLEEEER